MSTVLDLRRTGDVLEVVITRSERRNALSRELLGELASTFTHLGTDVKAVVLASEGPVFSAGADFADLTGTSRDLDYDADLSAASQAIRECGVPVVAAVHGPCMGAAVEVVTACEVRVVAEDAWFRVPAIELGLLYNPESIRRFHAALPRPTLTRLLVLAERVGATDALVGGLATHVASDVRTTALALASRLAGLPTEALTATRGLLSALDEERYDPEVWQATRVRILDSPDRRSAVANATRTHVRTP